MKDNFQKGKVRKSGPIALNHFYGDKQMVEFIKNRAYPVKLFYYLGQIYKCV
jgi:hypothetical protein